MGVIAGAVISGLFSLYAGSRSSSAYRAAGRAAQDAAYANAGDLRDLSQLNAASILGTGQYNASSIVRVGEYNAAAVERETARNMWLYGIQAEEEVRLHIRKEKSLAGEIRAQAGASGWQVNTGSPRSWLMAQVAEGEGRRDYMIFKHTETLLSMKAQGEDQAELFRLVAGENAGTTLHNSAVQANLALAEAERQALAMERGGDVAAAGGAAQGSAALWGGVAGAATSFARAYTAYSSTPASTNTAVNQTPAYLSSPGAANYPGAYGSVGTIGGSTYLSQWT